jgi:hypothetical protein
LNKGLCDIGLRGFVHTLQKQTKHRNEQNDFTVDEQNSSIFKVSSFVDFVSAIRTEMIRTQWILSNNELCLMILMG